MTDHSALVERLKAQAGGLRLLADYAEKAGWCSTPHGVLPAALRQVANDHEAITALADAPVPPATEGEIALLRKKAHDWNSEADRYLAQRDELQVALQQINALPSELAGEAWAIARAAITKVAALPAPAPQGETAATCEHGTAWDVHCCGCHSGFLFDVSNCVCLQAQENQAPLTAGDVFVRGGPGYTQAAPVPALPARMSTAEITRRAQQWANTHNREDDHWYYVDTLEDFAQSLQLPAVPALRESGTISLPVELVHALCRWGHETEGIAGTRAHDPVSATWQVKINQTEIALQAALRKHKPWKQLPTVADPDNRRALADHERKAPRRSTGDDGS